ncbi:MAG: FAD-binding oxidoreductase [Thermoleophilaceae bacterium]
MKSTTSSPRRLKFWGWGYEGDDDGAAGQAARAHLGFGTADLEPAIDLSAIDIPPARVRPPRSLEAICSTDHYDRVSHSYGKSYRDLIRAFRGQIENPPDVVARPTQESDCVALLEWCTDRAIAAIPFGGGTSVVGGVEPRIDGDYRGVVTIDMRSLDRVLDVDPVSSAARIQGGASGPAVEAQLREHGLTLRHFPQSFEFSTLGGWLATRAAGHFATLQTHIDDLVESIRAVTPAGDWESRRLPGSGAGPSPDRMLLGSEGTLGVITEAWMRVQRRPRFRASAAVSFESFSDACAAARTIVQAGLWPSNCRVLDAREATLTGAGTGPLMLLGFESADHPLDAWLDRGLQCCADFGGQTRSGDERSGGPATSWRDAFLRAPYLRDALVQAGVLCETFETAHVWQHLDGFVEEVLASTSTALTEVCGAGSVSARLTHVYPDGAAPYFTVLAPARRGSELAQWEAIKCAASEAIAAAGATITHHHAVGRDHRPWYDRQRPDPFAAALIAAKARLDPTAVLNPGVLIEPA